MESVEILATSSTCSARSNGDSAAGASSADSFTEQVVIQDDTGSHAIVHAPLSPRGSSGSVDGSPGSSGRREHNHGPENNPQNYSPNPASASTSLPPEPTMPEFGMPNLDYNSNSGVMLGVQQLELQQQALEQRRQHHSFDPQSAHSDQSYVTSSERSNPLFDPSDDDQTEPSSSATGNTGDNPSGYTRSDLNATSTFGRLVQSSRKLTERKQSNAGDGEEDLVKGVLIYGYLQKLGRNGKWQTRWFETDGECLTYYKSSKRVKLLATLDLAKVGSIVINHEDAKGCCFTINISERPYHLQADSRAACKDWVITLNRVKEARLQEGNVKLFTPSPSQPPDFLDNSFTPRVVVVANRHRTRAVDDDDMHSWETQVWNPNPADVTTNQYVTPSTSVRLARWQKPKTSLSRLAYKVLRWARSLRKMGCANVEQHVILDPNVHPPGHDDIPPHAVAASPTGIEPATPPDLAWGRNELPATETAGQGLVPRTVIHHSMDADSIDQSACHSAEREEEHDEETRYLS